MKFWRAAIRAADRYWFLVGYVLILPYFNIVVHFTYRLYSLQSSLLVNREKVIYPLYRFYTFKTL